MFGIIIKDGKTYDSYPRNKDFFKLHKDINPQALDYFKKPRKYWFLKNGTVCEIYDTIKIGGDSVSTYVVRDIITDEWAIIDIDGVETDPHKVVKFIYEYNA